MTTKQRKERNFARRMRRLADATARTTDRLLGILCGQYGMTRVRDMCELQRGAVVVRNEHTNVTVMHTLADRLLVSGALKLAAPRKRTGIFSTWQLPNSRTREERCVGVGFGRNRFRWNAVRGGYEVSLGMPANKATEQLLVSLGFVWNNIEGTWFRGYREDERDECLPSAMFAMATAAQCLALRKVKDHMDENAEGRNERKRTEKNQHSQLTITPKV